MINFDEIVSDNHTHHNENWPYIPDFPYRMLIIGGSGGGKTNALLNLINEQEDIDKIYLYVKDPYEPKYKYLIAKREAAGIKHLNNPKAFIDYSNDMNDVYKNIDDYNPGRKHKVLIVFDDMLADILSNKKLQEPLTELFIRGRKQNISLVFISQSYFGVPKKVRLNTTHFLIMKIPDGREIQNIAMNHSGSIKPDDFKRIYRKCTAEPYSFLTIDTTLPTDNPLYFRKNLTECV